MNDKMAEDSYANLEDIAVAQSPGDGTLLTDKEMAEEFVARAIRYIEGRKHKTHKIGKGGAKYITMAKAEYSCGQCFTLVTVDGYEIHGEKVSMRNIYPESFRKWSEDIVNLGRIMIKQGYYRGKVMKFSVSDGLDRKIYLMIDDDYDRETREFL